MKGEWTRVLVFGIIFLILGFLLGRVTGHKGGHGKEMRIKKMIMDDHGKMSHHDGEVEVIIETLEGSDFKGDTSIVIEGGEINISKSGEEIEVEVEMSDDGSQRIEKKIIKKVIK